MPSSNAVSAFLPMALRRFYLDWFKHSPPCALSHKSPVVHDVPLFPIALARSSLYIHGHHEKWAKKEIL